MATSSGLRSLATVAALALLAGCGSSANQAADQSSGQPSSTSASPSPDAPSPTPEPSATPEPATSSSAPAEMPADPPAEITIEDFAFSGTRTVAPGATIAVTNEDAAFHSVTADGGAFDVVVKSRGGTKTFSAPTKPGRYPYICKYHPTMKGVLVVE